MLNIYNRTLHKTIRFLLIVLGTLGILSPSALAQVREELHQSHEAMCLNKYMIQKVVVPYYNVATRLSLHSQPSKRLLEQDNFSSAFLCKGA